jgi:UDP-N-acetylglucosamine--N-acetylmuramyl-(pentapeptide) pyrophosphoryl-undecaprenol N-acetylglucosamine transferase
MTDTAQPLARIALACGGTGGHMFPGLAVAEQLVRRGCAVTLLISPKEVDQQAATMATGMDIVTLPAVGLTRGQRIAFLRGFVRSYRAARKVFRPRPPQVALAMGGFASAPPILAAKRKGARTFLHESNSVPGRANRWLSWVVDHAFVGFPSAGMSLHSRCVTLTGTPVRSQFRPLPAETCRAALGLDPARPVILVMGGSQGASGINDLVVRSLPRLAKSEPGWQWIHLTGSSAIDQVARTYATLKLSAVVHPFFAAMELVLGAASVAVSRAGASSLAELAAMRLPAVLVPYPAATDNHQFHNARAFEETGAARLLPQKEATPEQLVSLLGPLVRQADVRERMQGALTHWHAPGAAEQIARTLLASIGLKMAAETEKAARLESDSPAAPPLSLSAERGNPPARNLAEAECPDAAGNELASFAPGRAAAWTPAPHPRSAA